MTESDTQTDRTDPTEYRIEHARLVGHEWDIELSYSVTYSVSLVATVELDDAIQKAKEQVAFGDEKPDDRMLVHSRAETVRDVYEDDVDAERIDWLSAPTAPSEETFWDDRVHFPEYVSGGGDERGE